MKSFLFSDTSAFQFILCDQSSCNINLSFKNIDEDMGSNICCAANNISFFVIFLSLYFQCNSNTDEINPRMLFSLFQFKPNIEVDTFVSSYPEYFQPRRSNFPFVMIRSASFLNKNNSSFDSTLTQLSI